MGKPTLLVLAAGIGSRYGGLKQIDPVGPRGETIIDYSVYDAMRAGFGRLVFVIRRDIERPFKETIGRRFEEKLPVEYVFQELSKLPGGFTAPPSRSKPWGTGHAILMGREVIGEPFAVINADDFYGMNSFRILGEHLSQPQPDYAMVGFKLRNTLSEHGSVARGVGEAGPDGFLKSVVELTRIEQREGRILHTNSEGHAHELTGEEVVSLNMWGFTPSLFQHLENGMLDFLRTRAGDDKAEFFIPFAVNALMQEGKERVKVLRTPDSWFGVTYREDRPRVVASVRDLIARGDYPEILSGGSL
jgi:dTDP-glucose pyrophosphorylase